MINMLYSEKVKRIKELIKELIHIEMLIIMIRFL